MKASFPKICWALAELCLLIAFIGLVLWFWFPFGWKMMGSGIVGFVMFALWATSYTPSKSKKTPVTETSSFLVPGNYKAHGPMVCTLHRNGEELPEVVHIIPGASVSFRGGDAALERQGE